MSECEDCGFCAKLIFSKGFKDERIRAVCLLTNNEDWLDEIKGTMDGCTMNLEVEEVQE